MSNTIDERRGRHNDHTIPDNILRTYANVSKDYHIADEAYCNDVIKTLRPPLRFDSKPNEIAATPPLLDEIHRKDVCTEVIQSSEC